MAMESIFPTQIYRGNLLPAKSRLLRELKDEALILAQKDQAGMDWSGGNYPQGYTSYGSIDQLHQFSTTFDDLRKKMDPVVAGYVKSLRLKVRTADIRLTRMWVNVMGKGCSHPMHLHPLSVVSGTFYVQTPRAAAALRFEDPRMNSFMARPLATPDRGQSSPYHQSLQPKAGEIILFESWVRHEVPAHNAETERISISFNYDWVSG